MKQKVVLAIIMIILSMSFVSCSYKEFEDSLRNPKQEVSEKETEQYTNQASIIDTDEITNEETTKNGNTALPKETIISSREDGEIQYTLNRTEIVQNIKDLNLALEDFSFVDDAPIDDSGNVLDHDGERNYFMAAYITVKNCNIDTSSEETEYPLQIEMCSGSESNILAADGPFLNYAVYFSAHPKDEENMKKSYYNFQLEPGTEMEVVVGWIVSESMLEEPYYYVINSFGEPEGYQYFLLNQSQEE